nr:heavy metal-associated isoprenylated plant protein 47-like [Quercus suber]POE83270.1 heavy metal-associated isoprenylated plant protein 47 [Quercus suber]
MTSDKCRTKAMKIAAKTRGVISVALEGSDKDQLAVIGEDVDSAKLTCLLGKKLCYASILSVEEMKPEENEDKELDDEKQESLNCTVTPSYPPFPRFCEVVVYDRSPSSCSIM